MHDCLQDVVRGRLVRFLKTRLARRDVVLPAAGALRPFSPLAETESIPDESEWFWPDNNAKAAELMAHPALWDGDPDFGTAVFDAVLAAGEGPMLLRRIGPSGGPARIVVVKEDPRDFEILTPMHVLRGDLSRGVVLQAVRSAGGGTPLRHTGNLVEFTHRGRKHCLDVEDAIAEYGLIRTADGGVRLHHAGAVTAKLGRFGSALVFGRLRYDYEVSPARPALLRITARFTPAPGMEAELSRIRVTTACDELSAVATDAEAYQAAIVDAVQAGAASVAHHRHADLPEGMTQVQDGPAGLISIVQERRPPGFAHALHMRPLDPGRLLSTKAVVERRGRLHWLLTRYAAETLDAGESLTVREERLLVGGGLHNDPACRAAVLARAESGAGDDLSLCYDYGAVLNAVATHILLAAGGRYHAAPPPGRIAGLRDWCDAHLDAYFAALAPGRADAACRAYSRELAFVTLALDGLWRATGAEGYRTRLRQAVDLLLSLLHVAVPAGAGSPGEAAFRDAWSGMAFLDCHAAAMLALARVALHREDPRFGPALRQALAAIRLSSGTAEAGEQSAVFDSLAVRCRAPEGAAREWSEDIGSASYKLGLMLRALRALQAARAAGAIALDEHEAQRAGFLATLCLDLLRSRIRLRQDVLEMRPGPLDRPTNLEAQAWSVLALLPTDAPIARTAPGLAPVAAAAE